MLPLPLLAGALFFHSCFAQAPATYDNIFSPHIAKKYDRIGATYRPGQFPHTTDANGAWNWVGTDWWTSGFLPGAFYLLNERKSLCPYNRDLGSVDWLAHARRWSDSVDPLQFGNSRGHDQGFLAIPFIEELKANPTNSSASGAVTNFARLLANRYSSTVGCTRSRNSTAPEFLVIMDNIMNLELLLLAAKLTGNQTLVDMAISHADKTIINHIRPDGSSYHIVSYNENTGDVIRKYTGQGYNVNSTWTRGQAWGIYGYAKMFSYTAQLRYLETARKMADVFISRLPTNGVPPWDFDAPVSNLPADTSAATIAAEGLFNLAAAETSTGNATGADYYQQKAVELLTDNFNFAFKPTWDSILSNGTSHNPAGSNNTGLIYGDYYALQAGNTMLKLGFARC